MPRHPRLQITHAPQARRASQHFFQSLTRKYSEPPMNIFYDCWVTRRCHSDIGANQGRTEIDRINNIKGQS
jgi:hypothetical protein